MPELIIQFPTLLDMLDFIGVAGKTGKQVTEDDYSIHGFFSDAEIELAQNGMNGEIKQFG
ncbi:MAG TPA: hypothetical protein VL095_11390 [Flavisolibacter sp.]|nr:hypothetical protein [Flavisolibacter sp.]